MSFSTHLRIFASSHLVSFVPAACRSASRVSLLVSATYAVVTGAIRIGLAAAFWAWPEVCAVEYIPGPYRDVASLVECCKAARVLGNYVAA